MKHLISALARTAVIAVTVGWNNPLGPLLVLATAASELDNAADKASGKQPRHTSTSIRVGGVSREVAKSRELRAFREGAMLPRK